MKKKHKRERNFSIGVAGDKQSITNKNNLVEEDNDSLKDLSSAPEN